MRSKTFIKNIDIIMIPWLSPRDLKMFYSYLDRASVYFEYGSGGSTFQANLRTNIKKIYSVESDIEWCNALNTKMDSKKIVKKYHEMKTLPNTWGNPGPGCTHKEMMNYSNNLSYLDPDEIKRIDLILIDGRFRVACCLKSFACVGESCIIAFDDFLTRPYYHVVLEYFDIIDKTQDNRMVFLRKKNNVLNVPLSLIAKYELITN
jgi:hypothetical protein